MFRTLLIANRGEIAVRIARTARRMGLRTVAVYSDADAGAAHVRACDTAVRIGPPAARDSYLKADAILEAAARTHADAIHPGYGFLSENAAFAEAVAADGRIFVGPPADAIRAMGLKDRAKALMDDAGVPVVPGYHGEDQRPETLREAADRIGYPVLIKAVAGGGGKGMRRVDEPAAFEKALAGARREAASAFGDERVLIERYVARPRHIEIQVFADGHGNAVHLFERDCSLQRRHQKVIEEAPAPGMPEEMRAAMGAAAVKAALAIGYRGAGTVEFIADGSQGLRPDRFFFMEMNTRLQVEHPVTEMITGIDLVAWQLKVAAGEALPFTQDEIGFDGHAFEARLYAEDPAKNFLPSTGRLARLRLPAENAHVRIDAGVREGDSVSMFYDPMIAKIIVWDADRPRALRRLAAAMADVEAIGVRTNAGFLLECARHPAFAAGDIDTGFIERHIGALAPKTGAPPREIVAAAALAELLRRRVEAKRHRPDDPWSDYDTFQPSGGGFETVDFDTDDGVDSVRAEPDGAGGFVLTFGAERIAAAGEISDGGTLTAVIDGAHMSAGVHREGRTLTLAVPGAVWALYLHDPLDVEAGGEHGAGGAVAPMPGRVVQVLTAPGRHVRRGEALVVLEAMKMEHTLTAPADGRVAAVNAKAGDQVSEGAVLVAFEGADA